MNRLRERLARWTRTLTLALAVLVVSTTAAPAQIIGYGGMGYGGMGYGYPGMGYGGFGYGYPGIGYGGYGGFGFPGFGYGYGFSIPGYYNYPGYTMTIPNYITPNFGYGALNPLFGLGLSPLGVESALAERYLLGRGLPTYRTHSPTIISVTPIGPETTSSPGTIIIPGTTSSSGTSTTPGNTGSPGASINPDGTSSSGTSTIPDTTSSPDADRSQ